APPPRRLFAGDGARSPGRCRPVPAGRRLEPARRHARRTASHNPGDGHRMSTLDYLKVTAPELPGRVQHLLDAPAELLLPERLLMYALVRGLRPVRCLEIGTHFGGSTTIT